LTITGYRLADALSVDAVVTKGADFTVIALARCCGIFTAANNGTKILCARILIIAFYGIAGAATGNTMVSHGAWVLIITRSGIEYFVETTFHS
jgi:hypothetical protein